MNKTALPIAGLIALPLLAASPSLAQQPGTQPTSPATSRATAPISLTREQIVQLQQALNENGFDVGEVDGVLGAKTSEALKRFQSRAGLQPTGRIDQQTLALVGMAGSAPQAPATGNPTTGQGSSAQPANPAPQPKRD